MHVARILGGLFGLALLFSVAAPAAQAQQVPPPGSYRQSCNRVLFNNNVITAFCRTRAGDSRATMLNVTTCAPRGDISNQDGRLVCPRRGAAPPPPAPPPGSYRRSCREISVGGMGMLRAECRMMNGAWNWSRLNLNNCRPGRDIANINGQLTCN